MRFVFNPKALKYYLTSVPTIIRGMSFLRIPLLLVRKPILITTNENLKFYVKTFLDIWILKEVVLDRQYEQTKAIRKGDVVIDIGASVGDFSILASQKARVVYSFDMDKGNVELMEKNLKINNCRNVDVNWCKVTSLEQIFEGKKVEKCDFMKIDCEGCEYELFQNVKYQTLGRIEHISMEVHFFNKSMEKKYAKLKILLRKSGFEVVEVSNPVHSNIKLVFADRLV